MIAILKRLIGRTPSIDEIVAPLARITANLEAAINFHNLKVEAHDLKIKALQEETLILNAARIKAAEIKAKINHLIGD